MLFRWVSSLNCPKFAKICPLLFIPHIGPVFLEYDLLPFLMFFSGFEPVFAGKETSYVKDTLKAFDDFINKQQKCMK